MVAATAIRLANSKDGKPSDMSNVVEALVQGAGDKKDADASESEYLDDQWWSTEEPGDSDVDVSRGDN